MNVIMLLLILAAVGFVAWLLMRFIPMPQPIRTLIIVAAVIIDVLILVNAFGGIPNVHVPSLR